MALRPVDEVDDIEAYDAVILGGPVYNQRWMPDVTEFLRRNADALATRRTWLFRVGSFGDTHGFLNHHDPAEPPLWVKAVAKLAAASHDEASARDARRRIAAFFDAHLKR